MRGSAVRIGAPIAASDDGRAHPKSRLDVEKIGPPLPPMVAHAAVREATPPFEPAYSPRIL